jgi:hypothetical protein
MSKKAFGKIAAGLTETLAIARGEAKPTWLSAADQTLHLMRSPANAKRLVAAAADADAKRVRPDRPMM